MINKSPGIKNIDKDDDRNPFLLSAYAMDIFDYLRSLEVLLLFYSISHSFNKFSPIADELTTEVLLLIKYCFLRSVRNLI